MNTSIVFVTHNRLEYTLKSLPRLLNDEDEFDLYIWDNASTDGTPEYLMEGINDPRIKDVFLSKENLGPTAAMRYFWERCKTSLVGKVDNDCLMTPGWIKLLAQAHADIDKLGAIACWHYRQEDFNEPVAMKKIQTIGRHQIVKHPWVCGSGFLMKRQTFLAAGPLAVGSRSIGMTEYYLQLALAGYLNGWYYPLVIQEHMDDPFSPHCMIKDDRALLKLYDTTYVLREHQIKSVETRLARRKKVLNTLLCGPAEARHYVGWRAKFRRFFQALNLQS